MEAAAQQIADRIAEIVNERDYVSFAELAREWPEHFRDGERGLGPSDPNASNIYYWTGLSALGTAALRLALAETVKFELCGPLCYFVDGAAPNLPLAKRVHHYKEPHWLPVTLRPIAAAKVKKSKGRKAGAC